uniref:Uncharacterized protein n=1 Tax=Arundo donax TaxID=35708 RepID=A0A0A9A481_ARUDO
MSRIRSPPFSLL